MKPLFSYPKPEARRLLHEIERKAHRIYEMAEDGFSHNDSEHMQNICKDALDVLKITEYLVRRLIDTFED
jgi:hypothetical protein